MTARDDQQQADGQINKSHVSGIVFERFYLVFMRMLFFFQKQYSISTLLGFTRLIKDHK
jgi:hypothetical protein